MPKGKGNDNNSANQQNANKTKETEENNSILIRKNSTLSQQKEII